MSTIHVPALDEFPEHRNLLERAVAHFQPDPRVVGLMVSGSIAGGRMDFYSDVDLDIRVDDDHFDAVFAERARAAEAVGDPFFCFDADHLPFENHFYIVLYPGPVKLDFLYGRASALEPQSGWADFLILKDRDGLLAEVKAKSQGLDAPPPDHKRLHSLNQKFWTWCWYVFGKIVRGEWWEALDGVHAIRTLAVVPMLGWATHTRQEGYRRLEQKLDPATADRLAATVATLRRDSLYAALVAEIALFRDLRDRVFEQHGLTFDRAGEQALEKAIVQRWSADSPTG